MVKKSNYSFLVLSIIIFIIAYATSAKIYNNHIDKQYLVLEKKICESAKKCIIDDKCKSDSIKLRELIDAKYIKTQVDPVTKEFVNKETTITYKDGICNIDIR